MMRRVAGIAALVITAAVLFWAGLSLRAQAWEWTMPIRFEADINNGYNWGQFAHRFGYFNVYDELGEPTRDHIDRGRAVDYGPLRLGVMSAWVDWVHTHYPQATDREPSAAFHAPLLWFNTAMETLTAIATFVLVMLVAPRNAWRPWVALIGAAITWFNPLIITNAHTWPQWDIWPMPFFLFAICCGLRRRWLIAGLLIGVGAMLKGQILMVAWMLPLWALFIGDWRGALRVCIGAAASVMLIGIVWELSVFLPGPDGLENLGEHAGASVRQIDLPAALWCAMWLIAAIILPRRFSTTWLCLAIAASLGSTYLFFNASSYWLQSGLVVGTSHYMSMQMGTTSNLPAILAENYGWNDPTDVVFGIKFPVTMRTLLLAIYFALSLWCVIRAAVHNRRGDPRVVLAICLPWLLFYCLPAQIHERYLIFFSACAGALVVCGAGWALLGLIVTGVGLIITVHNMVRANFIPPVPPSDPRHTPFTVANYLAQGTHPGIAWMLLLIAVIGLYTITVRSRALFDD